MSDRLLFDLKTYGADVSARTAFGFGLLLQKSMTIFESACCRGTLLERTNIVTGRAVYYCDTCTVLLTQVPSPTAYGVMAGEEEAYFQPLLLSHQVADPLETVLLANELAEAVAHLRWVTWG